MLLFIISAISLLITSITMLARANDLRWRKGLLWNARLIGFILAGVMPFGIIGYEWISNILPSVYECLFRSGIALVFLTTPYLPPWWKWISGKDNGDIVWTDDRRAKHNRRDSP